MLGAISESASRIISPELLVLRLLTPLCALVGRNGLGTVGRVGRGGGELWVEVESRVELAQINTVVWICVCPRRIYDSSQCSEGTIQSR